jgi:putative tricarboxylic transport membrane protein
MTRRKFVVLNSLLTAVLAFSLFGMPSAGNADEASWVPTRTIELVVPNGPGGANDLTARTMQLALTANKLTPKPVIVVNKPGGGGALSRAYLNRFQGEGNVLAIAPINILTNPILGPAKDTFRQYSPVAILLSDYIGIAVRRDSSIKTMADLGARLKNDPQSLSIAIATSIGNQNHIAIAEALRAFGVDIKRLKAVIFSSISEATTAVLGGHVDVYPAPASFLGRYVKGGEVRVLCVSSPARIAGDLAAVPTWKEVGVNSSFSLWRGLIGPKGMTKAQLRYWDQTLAMMAKTPEWVKFLSNGHQRDDLMNHEETAKFFAEQEQRFRTILGKLGLAKP